MEGEEPDSKKMPWFVKSQMRFRVFSHEILRNDSAQAWREQKPENPCYLPLERQLE